MEINDIIFIDSYPSIDLHGYDRESARVCVNDFIRDNLKLKNEFVVIIHGRGCGIIKQAVHDALRINRSVDDFKTFYNNVGATVVKINLR